MRLFVAGPGALRSDVAMIIKELSDFGCSAYDWTNDPAWEDPSQLDPIMTAAIDLTEVEKADALIWYLDGETHSHGAPFEVGYAVAKGKPVVVLVGGGKPVPSHWIYAWYVGGEDLVYRSLGGAVRELLFLLNERDAGAEEEAEAEAAPLSRPINSTTLGEMSFETPLWSAEQTKQLLQALEAKFCGVIDQISGRIDIASDRINELEEWRGDAEQACPDISRVRRMRIRAESVGSPR